MSCPHAALPQRPVPPRALVSPSGWCSAQITVPKMHRRPTRVLAARADADIDPVPPAMLPPLASAAALNEEAQLVGDVISMYLDEEWTPLEVHWRLGAAVAESYRTLRADDHGAAVEAGDILLAIGQDLMSTFPDFKESFVGPFDVANKVLEILMLRAGCEVCCTSEVDRAAVNAYWGAAARRRQSS